MKSLRLVVWDRAKSIFVPIPRQELVQLSIYRVFFNPFPNKPWFLRVCNKSLLNTLWGKEKLLVTSNFSFSHSVFLSVLRVFLPFSINLKFSSANSFSFEESKDCRLDKGSFYFRPISRGRVKISQLRQGRFFFF